MLMTWLSQVLIGYHIWAAHIDQFVVWLFKLLKCKVAKFEVKFVGHYVVSGFWRPDSEKFMV